MVCCAAGSASSDGSGRSPWSPLAGACCCLACLRGHMHEQKVSNRVHAACSGGRSHSQYVQLIFSRFVIVHGRHVWRLVAIQVRVKYSLPRERNALLVPLFGHLARSRGCERRVFPTKRCHRFSCNGTGLFSLRVHSVDPNLPPSYRMTHANDRHVPFLRGVQQ